MAGDVYVKPHFRSNGTYVEGYHRSAPDNSYINNYNSQGNVNPYTGQQGTRSYDSYLNDRNSNNNSFDY